MILRAGLFFGALCLLLPASVAADETVVAFMDRYETALDRGDTALLSHIYAEWSEHKESALRNYFGKVVAEYNVEFSELEIDHTAPDRARIRFLRRDRFTDTATGRRVQKKLRLVKTLEHSDGHWKVAPRQ